MQLENVYQISVILPRSAIDDHIEFVSDVLLLSGISPVDIVVSRVPQSVTISCFSTESDMAIQIENRLKASAIGHLKIMTRHMEVKDWLTKWQTEFKPFYITPQIEIVPAWLKDSHHSKSEYPVYIDTSVAFGTGLHPTTRYMVEYVTDMMPAQRCLDIGTGTGILAIIAAKMGGTHIEAMDISDDAIGIAKKNWLYNGLPKSELDHLYVADISTYRTEVPYDVVLANLITHDLVEQAKTILNCLKKDGFLAVSGVSIHHQEWFRDKVQQWPVEKVSEKSGEGWAAMLFRKLG